MLFHFFFVLLLCPYVTAPIIMPLQQTNLFDQISKIMPSFLKGEDPKKSFYFDSHDHYNSWTDLISPHGRYSKRAVGEECQQPADPLPGYLLTRQHYLLEEILPELAEATLQELCFPYYNAQDAGRFRLPVLQLNDCFRVLHPNFLFDPGCVLPKKCGKARTVAIENHSSDARLCVGEHPLVVRMETMHLYDQRFEERDVTPSGSSTSYRFNCDAYDTLSLFYIAENVNTKKFTLIGKKCVDYVRSKPELQHSKDYNTTVTFTIEEPFVVGHTAFPFAAPFLCNHGPWVDTIGDLWNSWPIFLYNSSWGASATDAPVSITCRSTATLTSLPYFIPNGAHLGCGPSDECWDNNPINSYVSAADGTEYFYFRQLDSITKMHTPKLRSTLHPDWVPVLTPSTNTFYQWRSDLTYGFLETVRDIFEGFLHTIVDIITSIFSDFLLPIVSDLLTTAIEKFSPVIVAALRTLLTNFVQLTEALGLTNLLLCAVAIYIYTQKFYLTIILVIIAYAISLLIINLIYYKS